MMTTAQWMLEHWGRRGWLLDLISVIHAHICANGVWRLLAFKWLIPLYVDVLCSVRRLEGVKVCAFE